MNTDPIVALRACFLTAAAFILVVKSVPTLSSRFLAYGSRADSQPHDENKTSHVTSKMANKLAAIVVPHSWFASFYVVSTFCSLLWASQIVLNGPLFRIFAVASKSSPSSSMSIGQVAVTWSLMLVQGIRRLYECLSLTKPSSSRMWIGHWAFGIYFYTSINIAIWIEASANLLDDSHRIYRFNSSSLSTSTIIGTLVFLLASGVQHVCHVHLASLKKYTVPDHPAFHRIVCPHYLAECVIYLALSIIAAPPGNIVNRTIFCGLVLVAVNLGITADGTGRWYEQKFGTGSVKNRWRMIPLVF